MNFSCFCFFHHLAVQHERAPKVHVGAAVQQSNVHHFNPGGPSLYGSRYLMQDLIFPFPMHLSSHMFPNFPIPLDSYYNPNPYFNMNPLQAMNLKTIDSKYKPNTMPSASYSSEFGKSMNSNVFPDIKTEEKFKCGVIPKEDEVTSSEESIVVTEVQKTTLESTALLLQTTRKILLTAIKWAKSIPSFQQLSIEGTRFSF